MTNLLEFEPIKKFIDTIGEDIAQYLGNDDTVILCLRPEGPFYGEALKIWLKKRGKKNVLVTSMEDDGADLEEKLVRGRKVLIVNNDVVTGKSYKRSTEALRLKRKEWNIKDIKFAVFFDRVGVADFSVAKYSAEGIWHMNEMDAIDLKIIAHLSADARKPLAEIGKSVKLSSVAVKNRLDQLLGEKILIIQGRLSIDQFYTISAEIGIEANANTVAELVEKFEKKQEVYHLVRGVSGKFNLMVGVVAHNLENIETFIEEEIRMMPGVKRLEVYIGELPVTPKTILPRF